MTVNKVVDYYKIPQCLLLGGFMNQHNRSSGTVGLVGKVPVQREEGLGTIPGWTNTQLHKIIEKVLRLL